MARSNLIFLVGFMACCLLVVPSQADTHWHVDAGALTLDVYVSRTAHQFHVVDQIAKWSEFCHQQYAAYFEALDGGLSQEDRNLLAEHAAIRGKHGWGQGLEQTFYSPLDLEAALEQGVKENRLTEQEAQTEKKILEHFSPRVEALMAREVPTLEHFGQLLLDKQAALTAFANDISRFVGGAKITVPVYIIANPGDNGSGGGFNGGRLTLEIAKNYDVYPTLLHEFFHAFLKTRDPLIEAAAKSVEGLDIETLSEGLAYAYSPGIARVGDHDELLATATGFWAKGAPLSESYPRFNIYGLALRPLLKQALDDKQQTLETFLPRATDAWRILAELDKARGKGAASQEHDYKKDPRPSIFIFGLYDKEGWDVLMATAKRHVFGRNHDKDQYQEMLAKNAKPGDTVILLLSLDDPARVPEGFGDLLPSPWAEIEGRLKQGATVLLQAKVRDMTVFLLATPTGDSLRTEFRRCAAEKKFIPEMADGGK